MAYAVYLVMLGITSLVFDYLTESYTKIELEGKLILIIAIGYGPAFLMFIKTEHEVVNDFNTFKTADIISKEFKGSWEITEENHE